MLVQTIMMNRNILVTAASIVLILGVLIEYLKQNYSSNAAKAGRMEQ
jgi:hypothetical protein